MNRLRTILAPIAAFLLLGINVWESWTAHRSLSAQARAEAGERSITIEERLLYFQSKVLIGAKLYMPELLADKGGQAEKQLQSQIDHTLEEVSGQLLKLPEKAPKDLNERMVVRERAVVAARLGNWEASKSLLQYLDQFERTGVENMLDNVLNRVLADQRAGRTGELREEEKALLVSELFDFAKLLDVHETPTGVTLDPEAAAAAKDAWLRFFAVIMMLLALFFVAFITFCILAFHFLTGRAVWRFEKGSIPPYLLIETFVLYFGMMAFSPKLLEFLLKAKIIPDPLTGNAILILTTILTLFWPLTHGVGVRRLARVLGLYFGPVKKFFADIGIAPFYYLASWLVIALVLAIYSVALTYFDVNISQGAHPIIPILLSSNDPRVPILIILLATAIAPIIEEVMFRGVLYGYLRQYLRALWAIPLSAFIFAIVHPQGAIGLVPLTAIGIMLALLREWRGSLAAPMVAHACVNGGTLLLILTFFQ